MALALAALRVLLGGFFALTGAAKLSQISAPVSQQMVEDVQQCWGPGYWRLQPLGPPSSLLHDTCGLCLGLSLGLPPNVATLAVLVHSAGCLGLALCLGLLNLALAYVLFTLTLPLWLTYYLGPARWPFPEAACRVTGTAYFMSTLVALISLCRHVSVCRPSLVCQRPR